MAENENTSDKAEHTDWPVSRYPILRYFRWDHLPPKLQEISAPFGELARKMALKRPDGCPETAAGLRKLLEAKDCAVRAALVLLLSVAFLSGCAVNQPPPGPPVPGLDPAFVAAATQAVGRLCPAVTVDPFALASACGAALKDKNPLAFGSCVYKFCTGQITPTPQLPPVVTQATQPPATPTPPGPVPSPLPVVAIVPVAGDASNCKPEAPQFEDDVRVAVVLYEQVYASEFISLPNPPTLNPLQGQIPLSQNWLAFSIGVCSNLKAMGRECVVDANEPSNVDVASSADFHEAYALWISPSKPGGPATVRDPRVAGGYRETCRPRGYDWNVGPAQAPTATPAPAPTAVAGMTPPPQVCRPLKRITLANFTEVNAHFSGPSGQCVLINAQPRFDPDVPCDDGHPNCGPNPGATLQTAPDGSTYWFPSDGCEPNPASVHVAITAAGFGPMDFTGDFVTRACSNNPANLAWHGKVWIDTNAKDKLGRPIVNEMGGEQAYDGTI